MASSARNGPEAVRVEGAEVRGTADRLAEVAGQRPDVRPGGALDVDDGDRAVGVGVVPRQERQVVDRHVPLGERDGLAGTGHRVGPPAADLDRAVGRRPLRDRPEEAGQRRLDRGSRRRRPGRRGQLALEVVGRGRGAEADRRAIRLAIAEVVLDDARPVAEEDRQHARRERIERAAVADALGRRQAADEGDDVVRGRAGRLGDDEDAVEARPERRVGHRQRRTLGDEARRPRPGPAGARRRPAAPMVAPAARACPPPPNAPVRTVASTPPGRVRTLSRVPRAASLNRMATSASSAWARRSMIPSECGGDARRSRRGRRRRASTTRSARRRRSRADRGRGRTGGAGVGLGAIQPPRDVGQRRAGLDQGRGDGQGPRRRVRVGERRGVHDDAGHQRRGQRAVAGVERDPEPDGEQRDHLAGRRGSGVDPVGVAGGVVRGVVVDDDPRQRARTARRGGPPTAPTRSSEPQSEITEQVVGRRPGPGRAGRVRRRAGSRTAAGPGRCSTGSARPPSASTMRTIAERRAERVRIRVLVADRQDAPRAAQPLDDDVGHRVEVRRQVDGHRGFAGRAGAPFGAAVGRLASCARRRAGSAAADGGSSARSPSCGRRATGVGSDSSDRGRSSSGRRRPRAR